MSAPGWPTRPGRWWSVALFGIGSASAAFTLWQNLHIAVLVDMAYFVNVATRIAAGDAPYVDFPMAQAPLSFVTQALLIKVFGPSYPAQIAYSAMLGGIATALTCRLARRILDGAVAAPGALAVVLTVPLVPLGIYAIYPHPFYDPDACLVILAAITAIFAARDRPTPARWILAGALLTIPLFVKQNIGGAFLVVSIVALAADALPKAAARAGLRWCIAGVGGALAVELVILQLIVGIDSYVRWAWVFALSYRGLPADRLGAFVDLRVIWPGLLIILLVIASERLRPDARGALFLTGLLVPVIGLAMVPALTPAAPELFPPVLIAASVLALRPVMRDGPTLESLLPFILTATTAGALMSQGLGGSTFGIFPLLVLAIASLVRLLSRAVVRPVRVASMTGVVLSVLLVLLGTPYALTNARLRYIDVDAPGEVTRSSFPSLMGLSARGPYIADLDAVLFWARDNVRPDEPMVFLPGEDPAYFALGHPPQLPSIYFYDVGLPYSPSEMAAIASEIGLRWVFVKDRLQLRDEPPLNQAIIAALTERATLVAQVSAYRVYRR